MEDFVKEGPSCRQKGNCESKEEYSGKWYLHPPMRNALLSGILTGLSFGLSHLRIIPPNLEIALYLAAIILGGYHWAWEGIEKIFKKRRIGIEILMLGATVGSAWMGMWDEAAFLVFLYGTAEGIEEYIYAKTRGAIRALLDLAPQEARVLQAGRETIIPAKDLKPGDVFLVKPGEAIPTDGIILGGSSIIDEAPVTGESLPVEKKEGMKVFAATLNQVGALEITATTTFEENTLSKMIHLVEEAQEQKSKAQVFIEKFGNRYSPLVLLGALGLIVIPWLLGIPGGDWTMRAIVLLVAAAPCALVMSTPVAIAAGIGKAGKTGVLIKGGVYLESLGKIKAIAFDKTGTLTEGKLRVTDIVPLEGSESEILKRAASVDWYSEHPLAKAIVREAEERGLEKLEITNFRAIPGHGAKAKIGNQEVYVGKPEFFNTPLEERDVSRLKQLRAEGKTVILVGTEVNVEGMIALRDQVRPQAKEIIEKLHRMGILVTMLTGDNETTAKAIGSELGIDEIQANLRPEEKVLAIQALKEKYEAVAMVGDGINDAPALANSTVGVAMGTAGTDAAIEAADVALMADDLGKVVLALHLGRKARKISLQNISFSLLILVVLVPSALLGFMTVALAVFLHETSEILAVVNGLRVAHSSIGDD